ncbi:MAG: glycine/D-amino acid oxidase-like deaminating enzyme [Planctomycetota bacterium]|jgi:glycine/D-amino acid oxidase-like deaminating enzyme
MLVLNGLAGASHFSRAYEQTATFLHPRPTRSPPGGASSLTTGVPGNSPGRGEEVGLSYTRGSRAKLRVRTILQLEGQEHSGGERMKARIVIVGGGVIGVSVALHAARRTDPLREPVMLLERDAVGTSPSACSAAVLGQFFGTRHASGMARDSLRYYEGLESKTGRSLGFLRTGVLTLAKSHETGGRERMRELVEMQDSIGIRIECVDANRIRALFPGIVIPDDAIGAWEPTAGCLDPGRAIESLSSLARNRGAVIRAGNQVSEIVRENGRVVGVETSDGYIACEQVVVTAGPWTRAILQDLGVDLPLESVLAERFYVGSTMAEVEEEPSETLMSLAGTETSGATGWYSRDALSTASIEDDDDGHTGSGQPALKVAHPVFTDPETGFYVRCDPLHRRASIGRRGTSFTVVNDPDQFDPTVTEEFSTWARGALESRFPDYADVPDVGAESGLFTRTPDNQPVLGPIESVPGLYVACGFAGHSFTMAPSVGEGIAQMLMGEPVSAFEEECYAPSRYM